MSQNLIKPLRLFALPVLALLAACENPVDHDNEHLEEIAGVEITDMAGTRIASYSNGTWNLSAGDALHLHPGEEVEVKIFFLAADGDRFQLPPAGDEHTLRVEIADTAIAAYGGHTDHGHFEGKAVGETTAKVQVYHGGHADYETNPGLPIEVSDHAD